MSLLSERQHLVNLLIFMSMWSITSFSGIMIIYYFKYLPGNFFLNYVIGGFASAMAYVASSLYLNFLSFRTSILLSYGLSAICGVLLVTLEGVVSSVVIAVCVLFCLIGLNGNFNNFYYGNFSFFPA